MTVVAAVARAGRVVMAADTCTNYAGTEFLGAVKIERVTVGEDEALLACSGGSALLNLALQHWRPDASLDPDDPDDVRRWAGAAASALSEIAAEATPNILRDAGDGGSIIDGAFLLGWRGRLIYLFTHAAVVMPDGVAGLGVGTDLALGAMQVGLAHGDDPETATRRAVELACERYQGCRVGPAGPQVEVL